MQKIRGGVRRLHLGIDKADQVAHEVIAKDQPHTLAALAPLIRTVEAVHRDRALLGAVEHAAIGGGPLEAQVGGQRKNFVGYRALRRPQTDGRDAEMPLHVFARQFELHARVVGIAEPRRQRHVGVRHARDVGIAQQGQDGMVVRSGGDLDLAGGGEPRIGRQHVTHNFTLLLAHPPLVLDREITVAFNPAAHFGVVGLEFFVEPGELRPHLHIAQFLGAEHVARAGFLLRIARIEELAIPWITVDHVRRIGIERMLQQLLALVHAQRLGGFQGEFEKRVAGLPGCVLFHLRHHGRHQVEGLLHLGKVFQNAHHAVVVFQGVHARPGELILAGSKVFIERLMHVP